MTINLLLNHTALIEDDRKPTVTVSPPYAGTLTVEGIDYPYFLMLRVRNGFHIPFLL